MAVVARNVRKTYPTGTMALQGVTLGINRGECLGLLGPNGAGKTTLINMLTGMLPVTSGRVMIGGVDAAEDADAAKRLVGICPQHDILWNDLTCAEHILFYSRLKVPRTFREDRAAFCAHGR